MTAALLGQAVKARRTQSNLRLEIDAALCGVAKQTLMKIEHGQHTSSIWQHITGLFCIGHKDVFRPGVVTTRLNDDWQ